MRLLKLILIAGLSLSCIQAEAGKKDKDNKKDKAKKEQKHSSRRQKKASLEDTYWRLSSLNNIPVGASNNEPYLFLHKGKVTGNTGCNDITGKYTDYSRMDMVKFNAATTEMACINGMESERMMQQVLSQTTKYKLNENNLLLYNGTILLAIFEAKGM
jgi:heat shock protein HslJ